jgi:tetratricopeptide (TPR) repeat protein
MKKILLSIFLSALLLSITGPVFASDSVTYKSQKVNFSGGTRLVNTVYVNMNDKNIRLKEQLAKNQVGQTDDFKKIVSEANDSNTEALAAINGTFFNSNSDMKPTGTIQSEGRFYHLGSTGSVIAFSSDNKVSVEALRAIIKGTINEGQDSWYAWNINSMNDNKDSIIIFDQAFGKITPKHDRTSIVINECRVTAIRKGQVSIPSNGYVIVLKDNFYIQKFHIGDRVDYTVETSKLNSASEKVAVDWSNIVTSVGAGPTLLKNGRIIADGKSEGFTEGKINVGRNLRSFAGKTSNNILIIGTVPNVTVKELAEICKKLNMTDAINLDGGSSSALYCNGNVVTVAGRKLSNVLVITRVKNVPPKYSLNGREVISSNSAYTQTPSQELMLPLKDTCTRLYADYTIKDSEITIKRFTNSISLKIGSNCADFNVSKISLNTAPVIKNGIIYVPAQSFIKTFGGSVIFDTSKNMYFINITNYNISDLYSQAAAFNKQKDYASAKRLLYQILKLDPGSSKAYYSLGYIYSAEKNWDEEISNFTEYIKYDPDNSDVMCSLGWAYDANNDVKSAITCFEKALAIKPKYADRWINLGKLYMRSNIRQYSHAIECFSTAEKYNPSTSEKTAIDTLIAECRRRMR